MYASQNRTFLSHVPLQMFYLRRLRMEFLTPYRPIFFRPFPMIRKKIYFILGHKYFFFWHFLKKHKIVRIAACLFDRLMHNMTKSPILWLLLMFYIYVILKSFRYALFKKLVYDYKKIRITCNKIAITYKLYFNNLNGVGDRVNKRVYKFRCTWTIIYGMYIKFIDRALYLLIIMRLTIFAIILQSELSWMTQRYSSLMSEKSKLLLRNLPIFQIEPHGRITDE